MSVFGVECGLTKMHGKQITKVFAKNGNESKLYKDLVDHLDDLPKEELDKLTEQYKDWSNDVVGDIDNKKHLALALYAQSQTETTKSLLEGKEKDINHEPLVQDVESIVNKKEDVFKQKDSEDTKTSKTALPTLTIFKDWLDNQGFKIKEILQGLTDKDGVKITPENSVDLFSKIVSVIKGEENVALPEEGAHAMVRLIKQEDKGLFKELMNKVGSYDLYSKVLDQYKDDKDYQLEDGKPNIPKLKEETIGKLFTEHLIKSIEGSTEKPELLKQTQTWWEKVKESLKKLFFGKDGNPFDKAVEDFHKKENAFTEGNQLEGSTGEETFKQKGSDKQDKIFDNIQKTSLDFEHIREKDKNEYVNLKNPAKGKPSRVSDRAKKENEKTFKDREIPEELKAEWAEIASTSGTAGHADIEHILGRKFDKKTGLKKDKKDDIGDYVSQINSDMKYYNSLEKMIDNIVDAYPEGTKFLWETPIYNGDTNEIGSPDLMVIDKDGVLDMYDWKFMNFKPGTTDIAAYKKRAFNASMKGYAEILRKSYGVTKFGINRIIPVKSIFEKIDGKQVFRGIETANSENQYKGETRKYMLPLPTEIEQSKVPGVQGYINQLNKLVKEISTIRSKETDEDTRKGLQQRIEDILFSIRSLQVKNDVAQGASEAFGYLDNYASKLKAYMDIFDAGKEGEYKLQDWLKITKSINQVKDFIAPYRNIDHLFKDNKDAKDIITKLSGRIIDADNFIHELSSKLVEKGIAKKFNLHGVAGYDVSMGRVFMDRGLDYIDEMLKSSSRAATRAGQLVHLLLDKVNHTVEFENQKVQKEYDSYLKPVQEWIKSHSKEAFDKILMRQGKDQWGLHKRYSTDFYKELKDHQAVHDKKWIHDNINVADYRSWYTTALAKEQKWAEGHFSTYNLTKVQLDQKVQGKIDEFKYKYDIDNSKEALSSRNDRLSRYPIDKWHSNEYKEIMKPGNEAIANYYNYLIERFKKAKDLGLLDYNYMNFLPMASKSFVEALTTGNRFQNVVRNLGKSVTLEPGDMGYSEEDKILTRYIHDISATDSSGKKDYSNISREILSTMQLFNQEMIHFEYASEVEDALKLILALEKEKKVYKMKGGKIIKKNGEIVEHDNKHNYEYLKFLIDTGLYGKTGSEQEQNFGVQWDYNKMAKGLNNLAGSEIMPLSSHDKIFISMPKLFQTIQRNITMKSLGLNPLTSIVNGFGGAIQSWFNSGEVAKSDFNIMKMIVAKANFTDTEESKVMGALLRHINPYTSNETIQKARGSVLNEWNKWISTNTQMAMMRSSDEAVETMNALAYLKNVMVHDGKLVNMWTHLSEKHQFGDAYTRLGVAGAEKLRTEMQKELAVLKEKNSILKTSKIVNGELVIPDLIDADGESVMDVRARIQQMTRDALGNRTPGEKLQMDNNMFGSALMLFHHWIPPLVETRFQGLNYVAGAKQYRYGRWNMLAANMFTHERGLKAAGDLISALTGNRVSIAENAKHLYEQKRKELEERGELSNFDANMTEAQFINMYVEGMKANIHDLIGTLALVGAFYGLVTGMNSLSNDDPKKGKYKAMVKVADKLSDELAFFYSPLSAYQLVGHMKLPIVGVAVDATKFLRASAKELIFDFEGDSEAAEKNQVLRYPISYIPGVNQIATWAGIFDDDISKYLTGHTAHVIQPVQ